MGRELRIVVVGAGIGGLVTALSLHEIGANVEVFESVREPRPLGVGINLLPHAVRELDALGLLDPLRRRSVEPANLVYCSHRGQEIWREPRGTAAGYPWPQLSIHRGVLQEVLLDAFVDRVGADHLHLGHRLVRVDADDDHASSVFATQHDDDLVGLRRRRGRGRRHPQRRARPALPRRGPAALERLAAVAGPGRGRAGPRWAHDGLGRASGPEVRRLPDRRSCRRPSGVQLHRRAASPRIGARRRRGLEPGRSSSTTSCRSSKTGTSSGSTCPRSSGPRRARSSSRWSTATRWRAGRSAAPTLLGRCRPSDVPDRLQRRVAGDPRRTGAGRLPPRRRRCGRRARAYEEARRPATAAIVEANRGMGPEVPMQLVHERAPRRFRRHRRRHHPSRDRRGDGGVPHDRRVRVVGAPQRPEITDRPLIRIARGPPTTVCN